MVTDYYDGLSENTAETLRRMQVYVDLALKQGDAIHSERAGELIIRIRVPKEIKK